MCNILQISFKEWLPKMKELFVSHWEEVASNKGSRSLNIDEELFFGLEEANALLTLGAFVDEELVGYSVNGLVRDSHDKSKVVCRNDALYVLPSHRKGRVGVALIKATERWASSCDCYGVVWHAKPLSALDKLLPKLHYEVKDILYFKEV